MKLKNWLKSFLSGAAMGIASAIPGVSGGTIAVITGVFKTIINAVNSLFKKFWQSVLILLPIVLGMIVAIIPCFLIFDKAFESFVFGLVTIFAGLVIGSFPGILDEVKGVKPRKSYIIIAIVSGLIALGLGISSILLKDSVDVSALIKEPEWWFYLITIPVGFLAAFSLVVPGISGSMLLLVLGFYNPLVDSISELLSFEFTHLWQIISVLGAFAVGLIIGFFVVTKLMGYLLNKHHDICFYSIIGFIIGSTVALYLNKDIYSYYLVWGGTTVDGIKHLLQWYIEVPVGILLGVISSFGAYLLVKKSRTQKQTN